MLDAWDVERYVQGHDKARICEEAHQVVRMAKVSKFPDQETAYSLEWLAVEVTRSPGTTQVSKQA